jgi:hypothetical protein
MVTERLAHVGEIGLSSFAGNMHLLKDDLLLRTRLGTPLRNLARPRAHLRRAIPAWLPLAQLGEERRSL